TGDRDFADEFFQKYIYGRELVDYKSLLAQAGLLLRKANAGAAWIGFAELNFEEDNPTIVSSTRIGSPLYLAGLDRENVILEIDGHAFADEEELEDFLKRHEPGETVEVVFEKNEEVRTAKLTFQEDPELEIVPFEHVGKPIGEDIQDFRENWLGTKSAFDIASLQRYCPKCSRAFAFEHEYCWYDGEELRITPLD
ncbi:PDZ domain-containing protein, partial [candidate division KSB1 bacterium]|nr:PDZ domain-containing protein [candidate division KSB1 bacterium]NIR68607.1 PDZ domain-containing protein [candidate division KSB1 bacterium]NIS24111.1 PDZ domain-containing protein [candidate division KSB1 bacterium]NIT71028.1 PDZ domain-containing protein [candidate division KSB1 bacterium]NIU24730.1 PDZ domain-containing protein [candidate division KSB1 bacterium]